MTRAATPDPYGLGRIPPIPTWIPPVDPDTGYPLMLCTPKARARTHSIHTGTDLRGSANVLTDDRSAPCGATTYNTNLVQVEAIEPRQPG
ncbi:MAG: hypothetical protein ACRELA_24450 [Candidatus Rokuibacteriota bacterium]